MHTNWAHEFPLQPGLIHLNHAGVGPWPKRTKDAIISFAKENSQNGSQKYVEWEQKESELRHYCQQLINAKSANDIAFVKSTSEALSIVAYGIAWQAHENVVYAQQEFPSNRIIWQSLQSRFGVEARSVDLYQATTPEDALFAQVDQNTRLIAVSAVQFANGLRMDLAKISQYCRAHNILLCVDAIQILGAIPFNLTKTPADFVMADGHKWLLSPEGIGMFYCNPKLRDQLHLNQYGWHMMEKLGDYEALDWKPASDARRFECGSPNNLGIQAMHASMSLILEVGVEYIYNMISSNISYIHEKYKKYGFNIVSDMSSNRQSGIITMQRQDVDNYNLYKHLQKSNVLCAYRSNGIRFSPHFYTPRDEIDHALDLICNYKEQ